MGVTIHQAEFRYFDRHPGFETEVEAKIRVTQKIGRDGGQIDLQGLTYCTVLQPANLPMAVCSHTSCVIARLIERSNESTFHSVQRHNTSNQNIKSGHKDMIVVCRQVTVLKRECKLIASSRRHRT